jgi:hypothetical protein
LSAVRDCLFNVFAATLRIWRPSLHPQPEDAPCRGDKGPIGHANDTRGKCAYSLLVCCCHLSSLVVNRVSLKIMDIDLETRNKLITQIHQYFRVIFKNCKTHRMKKKTYEITRSEIITSQAARREPDVVRGPVFSHA